jgi:hypothetical protein
LLKLLKQIYDHNGNHHAEGSLIYEGNLKPQFVERIIASGHAQYHVPEPLSPIKVVIPVIVTGMWKRPDIFDIFAKHTATLGVDVIVAGSEGKVSRKQAEKYGFKYIEIDNQPLATKMNATTIKAVEDGYSHVICLGSDDLISKELLNEFIRYMKQGFDFIGVLDWYFYDTTTEKASYWGGYVDRQRIGHTCGAGRVISASLLKEWNGQPWEVQHSDFLDNSMQGKLLKANRHVKTFRLKDKGLFAVDVKSSTNMTPFELWPNTAYIDPTIITSRFNVWDSVSVK